MLMKDYKERVRQVEWASFTGSKWYRPERPPVALCQLANLKSEAEIDKVASATIYSFGNDHTGAYYRAIFAALPFVVEVAIQSENPNSRNCARDILTDIYFSFDPDQESIVEEKERREISGFVADTIKQATARAVIQEQEEKSLRLIRDIMNI